VSDLTLGCGLGYALIFIVLVFAETEMSAVSKLGLIPLISLFTGTPHYGATLLRVYQQRSERRAYAIFAVWITAAVWAVFYLGLYSPMVGSLLLTVYLTWSPWHYSGQNYGIALMFLRRRGIDVTPAIKRLLYASFVLSFALTVLAIHGGAGSGGGEYAAVQPYRGGVFHLMRLGIPAPIWELLFVGLGAVYVATLGAAGVMLLRRASPSDLLPTATLVVTQMLWFSLPPLARHWGLFGEDAPLAANSAAYAFFWVATGHTVQYLWITTYYAAREGGARVRARFFGKALAAGSFIWSVPALLYTLSVEGSRFGGIAIGPDVGVLIAAAVNIHHFILDGAIWKLRDGRVARVLIRREETADLDGAPLEPAPGRPWLAGAIYAVGALATLAVIGAIFVRDGLLHPALRSGDLRAAHAALDRLEWVRHDGPNDYLKVGNLALQQKRYGEAAGYYHESLARHRSAETYLAIARLARAQGREDAAVDAWEQALALNPNQIDALYQLGVAWLRRGDPQRALELLERAARVAPTDVTVAASLERARQRAGAPEDDSDPPEHL
jgi:Tfp pilus assembly protein PilF